MYGPLPAEQKFRENTDDQYLISLCYITVISNIKVAKIIAEMVTKVKMV